MIYYQKVELTNFGPYEYQEFNFTEGKHLVCGVTNNSKNCTSNGSGKSSLFDAISWCIYKNTNRSRDVSREHKGNCSVKLYFSIADKNYRIERYYKHDDLGNSVKLYCNDEEISNNNATDTDNQIINLGFPNYELFISTVIITQGMPVNFSQLSNTRRKELIEDIFILNIWEKLRKKIKKYNDNVVVSKSEIEKDFTTKKEAMIALNSKIETIKQINDDKYPELQSKVVTIKSSIQSKLDAIKDIEKNIIAVEVPAKKLEVTVIDIKKEIEILFDLIKNNICPTCNQPLPEERLKDAKQAILELKTKLKPIINELEKTKEIEDKNNKFKDSIKTLEIEIQSSKSNLKQVSDEMIKITEAKNMEGLTEELTSINSEVNFLKNDLEEYKFKLEIIEFINNLLLPSSDFRSSIVEKYLDYINSSIEDISLAIFDDLEIQLKLDKSKKGIEVYLKRKNKTDTNYEDLSGGEKKRLDIIIVLAIQRILLESAGINTNLIVFDEIFDALDIKGIEDIIGCIDLMFGENTCCYVISHKDEIKNMFTSIITVENTNGIAKIS